MVFKVFQLVLRASVRYLLLACSMYMYSHNPSMFGAWGGDLFYICATVRTPFLYVMINVNSLVIYFKIITCRSQD